MSKEHESLEILFGLLIIAALFLGGMAFQGWVLSTLWNWFVVGLIITKKMTWLVGVGIVIVARMLSIKPATDASDETQPLDGERLVKSMFTVGFIHPGVALALGFLVNLLSNL